MIVQLDLGGEEAELLKETLRGNVAPLRHRLHARRALLPTVLSIVALLCFSGLLAAALVFLLGVDPPTAYLATSPGSLDSVAVIAASANVDIAFVMTLQTARLILVTFIGPWLARFVADRT